jgi:hypothetical protein
VKQLVQKFITDDTSENLVDDNSNNPF